MRVLKFGGTSVANAERFLRVADILESNAGQGAGGHRPLCPPPKSPTTRVAMIEKTISGRDALPNISDAERIFCRTSDGTRRRPAGIPAGAIENFRRPGNLLK